MCKKNGEFTDYLLLHCEVACGCFELCQDELLICLLVGGLPAAFIVSLFGR
jgi:hypothetical protein